MRRVALFAGASLLLVGCGSPGQPTVIVESNADELTRIEYTSAQEETYKSALVYEMKQIPLPEGMSMNYDIPAEDWQPYLVRARAFCDDARTNGWEDAQGTFSAQLREQMLNSFPSDMPLDAETDAMLQEQIEVFVPAQLRAIAAEGSLCPELAPSGFGTIVSEEEPTPTGSPAVEGTYFGEGCEGATSALGRLIEGLNQVEAETITPPELYDLLVEVGAGLMYGQLTETDQAAKDAMGVAADAVAGMGAAVDKRDSDATVTAIGRVSEAAIGVLDACDAAYPGMFNP